MCCCVLLPQQRSINTSRPVVTAFHDDAHQLQGALHHLSAEYFKQSQQLRTLQAEYKHSQDKLAQLTEQLQQKDERIQALCDEAQGFMGNFDTRDSDTTCYWLP